MWKAVFLITNKRINNRNACTNQHIAWCTAQFEGKKHIKRKTSYISQQMPASHARSTIFSLLVFSPLFTLLQSLFSTLSITVFVAELFLQLLSLWSCPLYTFFIAFFLQYSTHQVETRKTASVRTATAKVCKSSIKQRWRTIKRGQKKMVRESSVDYTFIVCNAK